MPTEAMKHIMANWADAANEEMICDIAMPIEASDTENVQDDMTTTSISTHVAWVGGKATTRPTCAQVRIIVPQNSWIAIVDAVTAAQIHGKRAEMFPQRCGVWHGAQKYTHILGISMGAMLYIERGLDMRGHMAVSSADIQQFYDNLDAIKIMNKLGMQHEGTTKAMLANQMGASIRVQCGQASATNGPRGRGALTGSRTAVALGRVPAHAVLHEKHDSLSHRGLAVGANTVLVACTYVDNL